MTRGIAESPPARPATQGALSDAQGQRWARNVKDKELSNYQSDVADVLSK